VFCDESYGASPHDLALFVMTCNCNSQPAQYYKNKIDKDNFKKIIKKNHLEWHCSNPQCEESYNAFPIWLIFITKLNFNQLNIKKIKSTKIILEKNITKKKAQKKLEKNHVRKNCINP